MRPPARARCRPLLTRRRSTPRACPCAVSLLVGFALPVVLGAAAVLVGAASLGQVLVAITIGVVLHLYQTRTPGFLRVFECLLSLAGALTAAFVRKQKTPSTDLTNMSEYFASLAWQIAGLVLPLLWFDWALAKETLRKSVSALHQVDFLFYIPLNSVNVRYDLTEPEPKNNLLSKIMSERRLGATLGTLACVLLALALVRTGELHLDDWFTIEAS